MTAQYLEPALYALNTSEMFSYDIDIWPPLLGTTSGDNLYESTSSG